MCEQGQTVIHSSDCDGTCAFKLCDKSDNDQSNRNMNGNMCYICMCDDPDNDQGDSRNSKMCNMCDDPDNDQGDSSNSKMRNMCDDPDNDQGDSSNSKMCTMCDDPDNDQGDSSNSKMCNMCDDPENGQGVRNYNADAYDLPQKGIKIMHLNVRHLYPNLSEIMIMLSKIENKPDILGFSETFLTDKIQDNALAIPGYNLHRRDRTGKKGGGLAVYVREHLPALHRNDLAHPAVEAIWLEVKAVGSKPILVSHVYRPPDSPAEWFDHLDQSLERAQAGDYEVIVMGDFNVDLLKLSPKADKLLSNMESFQFSQLIEEPTRIAPDSATLIDHVYVTCPERISVAKVLHLSISDHFAVFAAYSNKSTLKEGGHKFISYRDKKRFNLHLFQEDLAKAPWDTVECCSDVTQALDIWYSLYEQVLNVHAPVRKKRVKHWYQPEWINQDILDAIHLRDDLFKLKCFEEYKKQRNLVKRMIVRAKREHYQNTIQNNKGNSKKLWECIRKLSGSKATPYPSVMKNSDGNTFENEFDIASAFNEHFSQLSRGETPDKLNSDMASEKLNAFVNSKLQASEEKTFSIPAITTNYVAKQLLKLDVSKAKGMDNISPFFLKSSARIIAPSLTHILNLSLSKGVFPQTWKCAKVTPLHKKGAKDEVDNYRPISVLSCISKIIERHVHDTLYSFLNDNSLLFEGQSGFRPQHSCATALTHMMDSWLAALDSGNMVGVAFVDLSKAFDSVNHNILASKLRSYGCSSQTVNWFKAYLSGRSQVVHVKGHMSSEESIACGVPQGSILGPLLFLLFVNDLHLHITKCDVNLYADDTNIYAIGKTVAEIQANLTEDMSVLSQWCVDNSLNINFVKTMCMLISTSQKRTHLDDTTLHVNVNNVEIPMCTSQKLLGVYVNEVFDWSDNVKEVSKRLNYRLVVLKKIKKYLPEKARIAYCNGCILPHLDYCSTIWGSTTKANMDKILRLQKRAARMIYDDYVSPSAELFVKLKWLPLANRFNHNKAVLVYKCLHDLVPPYMRNIFTYQSNVRYSLRSEAHSDLVVPKPRIEMYRQSFSYSGAKIWNSLPASIRQSDSLAKFKKSSTTFQATCV